MAEGGILNPNMIISTLSPPRINSKRNFKSNPLKTHPKAPFKDPGVWLGGASLTLGMGPSTQIQSTFPKSLLRFLVQKPHILHMVLWTLRLSMGGVSGLWNSPIGSRAQGPKPGSPRGGSTGACFAQMGVSEIEGPQYRRPDRLLL